MILLKQGGLVMIPLLICSILMLTIIIERFWVFQQQMKTPLFNLPEPLETITSLRQHLLTLHTIITIAPMLGLLGTVTGLMNCFNLLGNKTSLTNPAEMSLGISEALVTTAAGIIIAIIAIIFYNYFNHRLENYISDYNYSCKGLSEDAQTSRD